MLTDRVLGVARRRPVTQTASNMPSMSKAWSDFTYTIWFASGGGV